MSVELKVFKNTEASLPHVSYLQISALSTTGLLVCPDLKEFISSNADGKIQWYKVMLSKCICHKNISMVVEHTCKNLFEDNIFV